MKKKICMIVPSFSAKGGITSVVSGYRGSQLEQDYEVKYIETYCDGNKLEKVLIVLKAYFSYLFTLFFWNPTIVHIHSSFGGSFYRKCPFIIVGKWFHVPIVNHVHGSYYDDFYFKANKMKKRLVSRVYNKCDYIIALSEIAKKQLEHITSSQVGVVENYGILHKDEIDKRQKKNNDFRVLFLGFITQKKGCFDIPKVAELVKKSIPNIEFVLAGTGDIELLKKMIPLEIAENFIFPGWITGKTKEELLSSSDLFFLPSYSEGMPMSILDAMGFGLPIVSTNIGGIPKIVHNGENGFLFDPGDVCGFSNAIIKILSNEQLRKKMEKSSEQILTESYSRDKHTQKLNDIYCFLIRKK